MQQVRTIDQGQPNGKANKNLNNVNAATGENESATSSTDQQSALQQRGVNNFMPTQAPQNSAFYFQQAQSSQQQQIGAGKSGLARASPKNIQALSI